MNMMKVMIESMNNGRRGLTEVCGTRRNGETEQNVPPVPRVSQDRDIVIRISLSVPQSPGSGDHSSDLIWPLSALCPYE